MSKIQWTDETWNPTVGCSRVSPGCDNCYAEKVAARGMQDAHRGLTEGGKWTGEVRMLADRLDTPLRWRKPRRVFVDSMSDLFHPDVPVEFILKVWSVMARTPQHTYQILTKRPQRMQRIADAIAWDGDDLTEPYLWPGHKYHEDPTTGEESEWWPTEADLDGGGEEPLPNVWLGASIEDDRYTFRADHVRRTPAAVRFLSVEPLLAPVPSLDLTDIDWCIIGGESGSGARPLEVRWVRDLIDQCRASDTAVFVKQLGARPLGLLLDDRKGGDWTEWPEDLRVREYPVSA